MSQVISYEQAMSRKRAYSWLFRFVQATLAVHLFFFALINFYVQISAFPKINIPAINKVWHFFLPLTQSIWQWIPILSPRFTQWHLFTWAIWACFIFALIRDSRFNLSNQINAANEYARHQSSNTLSIYLNNFQGIQNIDTIIQNAQTSIQQLLKDASISVPWWETPLGIMLISIVSGVITHWLNLFLPQIVAFILS